ncbi:hypothetical protein bpr_II145 (plasmid) [Butyrivibrio proteoclasticus B316]|uniref:Uncharacterized protein n=1 Tax=Butyrivibrio proteoclasticus (strain ATCC 51982 / DSM 14932 / B316) TaxID=515622 RepID=E0S3V1_BUTPB|nr:hypothetical protein [Butyrivibrio proteoclasticus]ADL36083.1 hypothetical protein bpr_II145 [Butyrivibrio proteoclasticus B316]
MNKLVRPTFEEIINAADALLADKELVVTEFGTNNDLELHIWKDGEFEPEEDESNMVHIVTLQDGEAVDDTEDTYVTDGSLYDELVRINEYRDFETL